MILRFLPLLAAAAALLATPALSAPARRAAPAATDWLSRITVTPSGGYLRGNPAAKVKLVEYASFTCSHCAAFQSESRAGLGALIRSGDVSLEVRNAVRDRFDLAAALLARCQGPAGFFTAADAIFAQQPDWLGRAAYLPEPAETSSMSDALVTVARGVGLDKVATPDLPPARVQACIANNAEQGRLVHMRTEAWEERKIPGTPAFLLNGQLVPNVFDWAKLEPAIRAALK